MAINYTTTLKNARLQLIADAIDADTNPGYLEIGTTGWAATLVTIVFNTTCGTVSGGVLTFSGFPKTEDSTGTGDLAVARIKDGAGTVVASDLTVGTSSADIILDTLAVTTGKAVRIDSASITHG